MRELFLKRDKMSLLELPALCDDCYKRSKCAPCLCGISGCDLPLKVLRLLCSYASGGPHQGKPVPVTCHGMSRTVD